MTIHGLRGIQDCVKIHLTQKLPISMKRRTPKIPFSLLYILLHTLRYFKNVGSTVIRKLIITGNTACFVYLNDFRHTFHLSVSHSDSPC